MVAFLINTLTAALTSSMLTGHGLMATPRMRSAPPMAISSPFTFDGRSSTETASPYDMGGYGRCASIGISNPRPCSHPSPNMCALPVSLLPLADEHGGMRGMNEMGGMGGYGRMSYGIASSISSVNVLASAVMSSVVGAPTISPIFSS